MDYKLLIITQEIEKEPVVLAELSNCPFIVKYDTCDDPLPLYLVSRQGKTCLMTNLTTGETFDNTSIDSLNYAIKCGSAKIIHGKLDIT